VVRPGRARDRRAGKQDTKLYICFTIRYNSIVGVEDAEEGDIVSVGGGDGEAPPTKSTRFSLTFNNDRSAAPAAPPPPPAGGGGSSSNDMASGERTGTTPPILNLATKA
jgi:hypothetical protein